MAWGNSMAWLDMAWGDTTAQVDMAWGDIAWLGVK